MSLFIKKPLDHVLAQAADNEKGLKRTLGAANLVALGIGAIIGAGLFVRTAAAAGQAAGPGVTLSFVVAAIGCAFAGLCYAEFASMIPIAGSAYAYSYVTMGEVVAWTIGWALIMEYALGAATVSIAWSEYLNKLLDGAIPYELCHSPFESFTDASGVLHQGLLNAPALIILLVLTLLLIRGTQESALVNTIIVFIKVAIVLAFIAIGWKFINPANYAPYLIPEGTPPVTDAAGKVIADYSGWNKHGWGGVLGGAAIVFFAFIGFDAVSTAAQEAKNPKRDMPIGILGSLVVCTILYILFGHVLTGVANWQDFVDPEKGREASVAYAISAYMPGYEQRRPHSVGLWRSTSALQDALQSQRDPVLLRGRLRGLCSGTRCRRPDQLRHPLRVRVGEPGRLDPPREGAEHRTPVPHAGCAGRVPARRADLYGHDHRPRLANAESGLRLDGGRLGHLLPL